MATSASPLGTASAVADYITGIFTNLADFKKIRCPAYLIGEVGSGVNQCYASLQEPEELLKIISAALSNQTTVSMGWRDDIGTWTSFFDIKEQKPGISVSLQAPGLHEDMRKDPAVNKYRSVATVYIVEDKNK